MFAGGAIKKGKRANEVNKQNPPQAETKFIASEVSWHVWNQFPPRNTFIVLIVLHSGTKRHDTTAGARESPPFINQSLFYNLSALLATAFPSKAHNSYPYSRLWALKSVGRVPSGCVAGL